MRVSLFLPLVLTVFANGTAGRPVKASKEQKSGLKASKGRKKSNHQKKAAQCSREVYSIATNNTEWPDDHTFHAQVWYHPLNTIHDLWKADYFDYVIDVRGLEDIVFNGAPLPGWETAHIPGSYPVQVDCADGSCESLSLDEFLSNDVCLDKRIFVHCWIGVLANVAVEKMVQLGFTNLHAAGPEGSSGFIQWAANGWETVEDDKYNPHRKPKCAKKCR